MNRTHSEYIPVAGENGKRCLSCGDLLTSRRRRYCSIECRRRLRDYLNRRTGLLVALNARYATFYFTDFMIVMDVLPYGVDQIFSFMLPRRTGNKPVEDYRVMSNLLGSAWWAERNRTHKRYKASQHVMDIAVRLEEPISRVRPTEWVLPAVRNTDLIVLKLNRLDLENGSLQEKIKRAYRQQAKKSHPDLGGDAGAFRRLQTAYEKLIEWSRRPTFTRKCGFPDKWLYEGNANRWIQPTPHKPISV